MLMSFSYFVLDGGIGWLFWGAIAILLVLYAYPWVWVHVGLRNQHPGLIRTVTCYVHTWPETARDLTAQTL